MPNYLIGYFCLIACLINVKLCASLPLSFVALSFSALEHIRNILPLLSRGRSIHRSSMAKIEFFCDTLTKTMDKNKGRPTSLPMKVSVDIVLTQYSVYVWEPIENLPCDLGVRDNVFIPIVLQGAGGKDRADVFGFAWGLPEQKREKCLKIRALSLHSLRIIRTFMPDNQSFVSLFKRF